MRYGTSLQAQARRHLTSLQKQVHTNLTLLTFLDYLDRRELQADKPAFACYIRECGTSGSIQQGRRIHYHVFNFGYDRDIFISNLLVQMYGNCRCPTSARSVFESIPEPNSVSWHLVMLAYAHNGSLEDVRYMFERMPSIRKNTYSWNIVATAYAQCGYITEAKSVFDDMPKRDVVSWNTLITAYVQADRASEALHLFQRMDVEPDRITFVTCIEACTSVSALQLGKTLHSRAATESLHRNVVVATALVNMYGKFGLVRDAKSAFDAVPVANWDVVLQTAMITAYSENGLLDEARSLFHTAPKRDAVCWTSMIVACGTNGELQEARDVFLSMPGGSVVSWNAMMAACVQNADYRHATYMFREMDLEGLEIDKVSCVSVLDAVANLTDLSQGRIVHSSIVHYPELSEDVVVRTALLNMYGKCGKLAEAREIFEGIHDRPIATWNAMIACYAQKGHGREVFELYRLLNVDGKVPDLVTFICMISTCSHAGLVEDGRKHFHSIYTDYGGMPTKDHYSCMLDLLGRAGRLTDAEELVEEMPYEPNAVEFTAVLGGCEIHGDVQRGKRVSGRFLDLDEEVGVAPYLLLSNLHAAARNHDELSTLRKFMVAKGIRKRK